MGIATELAVDRLDGGVIGSGGLRGGRWLGGGGLRGGGLGEDSS